jgi:hypothetical protein
MCSNHPERGGLATKIHLTAARPVPVHHRRSAREAEPLSCPSSSKSLLLAAGCPMRESQERLK